MIKESFQKGNRMKWVIAIIAVVALFGLIYPKQSNEWELRYGELRQEMNNIVSGNMTIVYSRLGNVESSLKTIQTQINNLQANYNNLSTVIQGNKSEYEQRLVALQQSWESMALDTNSINSQIASINSQISSLNDQVDELGDWLEEIEESYSYGGYTGKIEKVLCYDTSNGFNENSSWCQVIGNGWVGQQVKTGSYSIEVDIVELYMMRRAGSPSTVYFGIYEVDGSGFPVDTSISSYTFDASQWSTVGEWRILDIPDCVLSPNKTYVLLLVDTDGDEENRVDVGYNKPGTYNGGAWVKTLDGGVTWSTTPDVDMGFKIWGIVY